VGVPALAHPPPMSVARSETQARGRDARRGAGAACTFRPFVPLWRLLGHRPIPPPPPLFSCAARLFHAAGARRWRRERRCYALVRCSAVELVLCLDGVSAA